MGGRLVLVGCGKMGGALLGGWLDRGWAAADISVVEPDAASAEHLKEKWGIAAVADPGELDPGAETVVFAVKPQVMADMVHAYRPFAVGGAVFLSIAAGTPTAFLKGFLGADAAIVRAMPNTPAAVGRGITVLCANPHVTADQRAACTNLLAAVGETAWTEDEGDMDAVTAVSGSGPAYVFLLIECLAEAGVAAGLGADLAARLARATVAGAGELARLSDDPAATLRQNVTSPGGTTAAALDVLMAGDGLQPLMTRAVAAATARGRELAGG